MTSSPKSRPDSAGEGGERLQKVLAAAGLGSRRDCEELILQGRVEIDRQVVTELGVRVDWEQSEVRVDGEVLKRPRLKYVMLNKPTGVVTTNSDPEGRMRVIDLVHSDLRLFPVGRLDRTSEGLILLTNDGELANQLTHPRYGVSKTYLVTVAGHPRPEELELLRKGVRLAEGVAKAESVKIKKRQGRNTLVEIVLREGRNREIRRLLARVGHKVVRLKRIAQGPVRLGNLPTGEHRQLTGEEVSQLRRASRPGAAKSGGPGKGRRSGQSRAASSRGAQGRGAGGRGGRGRGAGRGGETRSRPPTSDTTTGAVLDYDAPAGDEPQPTSQTGGGKRGGQGQGGKGTGGGKAKGKGGKAPRRKGGDGKGPRGKGRQGGSQGGGRGKRRD